MICSCHTNSNRSSEFKFKYKLFRLNSLLTDRQAQPVVSANIRFQESVRVRNEQKAKLLITYKLLFL